MPPRTPTREPERFRRAGDSVDVSFETSMLRQVEHCSGSSLTSLKACVNGLLPPPPTPGPQRLAIDLRLPTTQRAITRRP